MVGYKAFSFPVVFVDVYRGTESLPSALWYECHIWVTSLTHRNIINLDPMVSDGNAIIEPDRSTHRDPRELG